MSRPHFLLLSLGALGALLAGATLCACRSHPRGGLAYGSATDVADVLASGGVHVPVTELTCINPTTGGKATRAIACTVPLTPPQIAALESGLPLAPHAPVLQQNDGSCEGRAAFASTGPLVRVLTGTNTRVPNGIGRVELHVLKASPVACVEVEYRWSG
ncbi:MAG: hypothetical protein ACRELB_00545 [Polyangiaceae bacterium]